MWTVLFDIDGTLITSGGAGMGAMEQTAREVYGISEMPKVEVHGRTDHGIISELFEKAKLDLGGDWSGFASSYCERLPAALTRREGRVLPHAIEVLDRLNVAPNVALGVLTGNMRSAAEIKLSHFGLQEYFLFGGYGDHFSDRNDVAKEAVGAAESFLGDRFDAQKVWVIGDTPNDVRCARAINAKVVAVETGGAGEESLRVCEPDLQIADLTQAADWVGALLEG